MPVIIVEVMPKAELLDPQGKAVAGALGRLGRSRFSGVRIGKRFELTVDGPADDATLAEARELAESILSNSVIEDVVSVYAADSMDDVSTRPATAADSAHASPSADSALSAGASHSADAAHAADAAHSTDAARDSASGPAGLHA